jgi:hypothetical protein
MYFSKAILLCISPFPATMQTDTLQFHQGLCRRIQALQPTHVGQKCAMMEIATKRYTAASAAASGIHHGVVVVVVPPLVRAAA